MRLRSDQGAAQRRWDFAYPETFLEIQQLDALLTGISCDFRILTFRELGLMPWPDYRVQELKPFALSARNDALCWWAEHDHTRCIVLSPNDESMCYAYASHLTDAIFRLFVEDLTFLPSDPISRIDPVKQVKLRHLTIAPLLSTTQNNVLVEVLNRPLRLTRNSTVQLISERDVLNLLSAAMPFSLMGKRWAQYR